MIAGVYERHRFSWKFPSRRRVVIRYVSGPSQTMCFRVVEAVDKSGEKTVGGGACLTRGTGYTILEGVEGEAVVSLMFPEPGRHVVEFAGKQLVVNVARGTADLVVDNIVIGYTRKGLYIGIQLNRDPRSNEKPLTITVKARKLELVNGQYRVVGEDTKTLTIKPVTRNIKHYIRLPQGVYDITVCVGTGNKTMCRTRRIYYYTSPQKHTTTKTTTPTTTTLQQTTHTYTIYRKQPMHLKTPLILKQKQ